MAINPNYFVGEIDDGFKGSVFEFQHSEEFDEGEKSDITYEFLGNSTAYQGFYWKKEGNTHKIFVPYTDEVEEEVKITVSGLRKTCTKEREIELDPSDYYDNKVIERVCNQYYENKLKYSDRFWKRKHKKFCKNYYDPDNGFRVFNGFEFRIEVLDDGKVLLVVNPSNSYTFASSIQRMYEKNEDIDRFFQKDDDGKGNWAVLHYPDGMRKIKLESFDPGSKVASVEFENQDGEIVSVYEYQINRDEDLKQHISKEDDVVFGRYSPNGDKYPIPASLVYPFANTNDLPYSVQSRSFMDPKKRMGMTLSFLNEIPDYIAPGNWYIDINTNLRDIQTLKMNLPDLMFEEDGIISFKDNPESSWPYLKKQGLKQYGPLIDPHIEKIFFAYPSSETRESIESFYMSLKDVAETYNIFLPEKRHVNFDEVSSDDFSSLNRRFSETAESYQYILAVMPRESANAYNNLKKIDRRSQAINSAYHDKDDDEDVLLNVLCGMIGEMGTPWRLADNLNADCIVGIDVSGQNYWSYSFTFGPGGKNLGATDGSSLEGEDVGKEKIKNGLIEAVDVKYSEKKDEKIEKLTIHRDGELTIEERRGLEEAAKHLKEHSDKVSSDFKYAAVDVRKSTPYKLYEKITDGKHGKPRMGEFHKLQDNIGLLVTHGEPLSHQATPQPLYLSVEAANYNYSIEDIAQDLFSLSELDASSAIGKSKVPVSIKYAENVAESQHKGYSVQGVNL